MFSGLLPAIGRPAPAPRHEPEPESTQKLAADVVAGQKAADERKQLDDAAADADAALEKAKANYVAEAERIADRRRACNAAQAAADRARAVIIHSSPPSDEELRLLDQTKQLLLDISGLRARYGIHEAEMAPPEHLVEHGEIKKIRDETERLEREVAKETGTPGHSYASIALQRMPSTRALEEKIEHYRQRYAGWQEIQALKRRSNECSDKRAQLQREREEAAIAAALATIATRKK